MIIGTSIHRSQTNRTGINITIKIDIGSIPDGRPHPFYLSFHLYEKFAFRSSINDATPPSGPACRTWTETASAHTAPLATDALAERVMRAGCTGIAFEDPETFCARGPIHRYRAATGIVEEDMEKILPPIC